jgi:hypothetical protein
MKQNVYGKKFVLLAPMNKVECWNQSDGCWANFAAGETIQAVHAYDPFNTVILWSGAMDDKQEGRPLTRKNGTPALHVPRTFDDGSGKPYFPGAEPTPLLGYRFIVNNDVLGKAIGVKLPRKTRDLVGEIMAYEDGTASPGQVKRLFGALKRTGLGSRLQGHYSSRMS